MTQLLLPILDPTRCTGCGDCVRLCPADCLALADRVPWLPRPLNCVSCAVCVLICPEHALRIEGPGAEFAKLLMAAPRAQPKEPRTQ